MAFFGLIFLLLALAALGLAVGALRGRPLPPGSCREAYLAGGMLPRCEGCAVFDPSSTKSATARSTGSAGGFQNDHRP
jgi:hypothetical protein